MLQAFAAGVGRGPGTGIGSCHRVSERALVPERMMWPEESATDTDVEVNVAVHPCAQSCDIEAKLWSRRWAGNTWAVMLMRL